MQCAFGEPDPALSYEVCRPIITPFNYEFEFTRPFVEAPASPIIAIGLKGAPRDAEPAVGTKLQFSNIQCYTAFILRLAPLADEGSSRDRGLSSAGAYERGCEDQC